MTEQQPKFAEAKSEREFCEIPFEVISQSTSKLRAVPMTTGLCVPKGAIFDHGEWVVEGLGGAHFPAQTEILNRWSDGSVRWLLVHFVAGRILPGRTSCALVKYKQPHSAGSTSIRWVQGAAVIQVRDTAAESSVESAINVVPEFLDADGQRQPLKIVDVREESNGFVRSVSVLEAVVPSLPFVELQLRIEAWPNAGHFKVETRIRNTRRAQHKDGLWDLGDSGSLHFGGLHLHVTSPEISNANLQWKAESELPVRDCSSEDGVRIVQIGSGSAEWASTNHVDANGESTVANRGYQADSDAGTLRGYRSEPVVSLRSDNRFLNVTVPEFWKQFPGSIDANQTEVNVGLFPMQTGRTFELQGGEQKTQAVWISTRPADENLSQLAWTDQQPRMVQSTNWIRQCGVISWLPETIKDTKIEDYLREATTGCRSITARRERIDEYGWRNFGDLHADHEQTHFDGESTIISHYNNQFDLVFGGIINLLLSGDSRWFDLFDPLARHVMDIDIYHTTEDRLAFNGGLFWHTDHYVDAHTSTHRTYSAKNAKGKDYGGGLSCEHNYTTGLLFYHYLTGNVEAKDTVVSLADWVINLDDGSGTVFGLLDSGDTGLASSTVYEEFQGPGRGVGNSINALVDAWTLTNDDRYIVKAEQLIRRSVHPQQDCDELDLINAEIYWSYSVCITAIGRYLAAKLEANQRDENYEYARQSLVNYGQWMATAERPTLSEPEKLIYVTEAWAVQDFRKANALRIAASCTDDPEVEVQMRQKADEINDAAWKYLYEFDDKHLTARCLSILMTEGIRDVFHRTERAEYVPPANVTLPETEWTMFVPQKFRVKQMLKKPLQLVAAVPGLLSPTKWLRTMKALRRQL